MKKVIVAVFALALIAAACGDDDATATTVANGGTSANSALIKGLTEQIQGSSTSPGDVPLSDEQAACFATNLIDTFGGQRIAEAMDMEFEQFMAQASTEERLTVVDSMLGCIDFGTVMAAQFGDVVSADSARCMGDAFVGSTAFRTALANSFGPSSADPFEDPALLEEMLPAMLECFTAEELINLGQQG